MIRLPFPPSTNRYWRSWKGRVLISRDGRAYRQECAYRLAQAPRFGRARLSVHIVAMAPDKRRRDLDNLLKASLDAMQCARLYDDDSQIDRLTVERGPVLKDDPHLLVQISKT